MKTQINLKIVYRGILVLAILLGLTCSLIFSGGFLPTVHAAQGSQPTGYKVSDDLRNRIAHSSNSDTARVILQLTELPTGGLNALLNSNGVHVRADYRNLGIMVVDLALGVINALAKYDTVKFISPDTSTKAFGHVSATTGADAIRT